MKLHFTGSWPFYYFYTLVRGYPSKTDFSKFILIVTSSQAGLLMLSQNSLDSTSFPQDVNLQSSLNAGDNKRKRHRSAGDYHTKTSRSNSVFNNWRPRHISGDPSCIGRTPKEILLDDDIFVEENVISRGNLEGINETVDSGVIVEDPQGGAIHSDRPQGLDLNHHSDPADSGTQPCDIPQRKSLMDGLSNFVHSVGTPVTENDPLGLFNEEDPGEEGQGEEKVVMRRKNIQTQPFKSERLNYGRHSANFDADIHPEATLLVDPDDPDVVYSVREIDPSEAGIQCNIPDEQKASFRIGSGLSLDDSLSTEYFGGGPRPLSQMEKIGKRLMGRTQSTPDNLDEQDRTSKSGLSAVTSYLKSFQSPTKKSQDSLDEAGGTPSESRFGRLGSFRKRERLSGAFKSAAGALMSKVNEIKQTISTPVKYGSSHSLGRSIDNLDVDERRGRDMPGRSLDHHRKHRNPLEEFDNLHPYPNSKSCTVILYMKCTSFMVYLLIYV